MSSSDLLPAPLQDSIPLPAEAVPVGSGSNTPTASTSTSARPDAKTQKYDRQLRLWAKSGQSALEKASVLVVNGSATASSTLKNLVLPGIGQFTILDPNQVTGADLGNNFFLESDSLGKPRAEEVVKYLAELNSDVNGHALVKSLATVLADSAETLAEFSLIIAVDVDPNHLLPLSDLAWEHEIPLIKVKSCGFFGSVRTQLNELAIVETHPESLIDLRVHAPFPALVEYANSFDFAAMNSQQHGHIPAVVILVQALESWRANHDGQGPATTAERKEFVQSVTALKRTSDEENFDEAVTLFRRAGTKTGVPAEIAALFADPACDNVSAESSNFWLLLRAVRDFVSHPDNPSGLLPLSGALPDMKAETTGYVDLQNLFKSQAKKDVALVGTLLGELLDKMGRPRESVTQDEVETFVKHSAFLEVVRGRSLRQEAEASALKGKIDQVQAEASFSEIPDHSLSIYLALAAAEAFFLAEGRYPGTAPEDEDGELDVPRLEQLAGKELGKVDGGMVTDDLSKIVREVCRAGASDLPQIAALLGGIVAQEAIKLITRQYIPLNGTCIFDGIHSTTKVIVA